MINYTFPLIGGKVIERRISEWRAEGRNAAPFAGEACPSETRSKMPNRSWGGCADNPMLTKRRGADNLASRLARYAEPNGQPKGESRYVEPV